MSEFSSWFEGKFLEWQMRQGRSATMTEFADYLGITQQDGSNYKTGRATPVGDNLFKIAQRLGFECYEILGIVPPVHDTLLLALIKNWDKLSDAIKHELQQAIAHSAAYPTVHEAKPTKYKTKKG